MQPTAYHLYGIERDAMTMMTKTYNLWAMIASARIYNKTPTWYYHRALGALNKIDRRESRGQLAYTDSSPTVRYTSLPREVRGRVKDFLKAITEQDEIARCGTDWIAGDLDWTYPTDVIREASMIEFDDLFFKYFCRSVSERKHACGSLFPGENYDTEHGFFRHWDPLRKLSCVFNCTPLQIWQSISLKLMLNVTDKTVGCSAESGTSDTDSEPAGRTIASGSPSQSHRQRPLSTWQSLSTQAHESHQTLLQPYGAQSKCH